MTCKRCLCAGCSLLIQLASIAAGQPYTFEEVSYPGAADTIVNGLNDAGVVVGTYGPNLDVRIAVPLNTRGFIRTGNVWQSLQASGMMLANPSVHTVASAINNLGIVVGQYLTDANRIHGFVFDGVNYVDVLPPGATEATVSDINDNGIIIGSYSNGTSLSTPTDEIDVHGFTAMPNGVGGYTYSLFNFPTATSTFGGGNNDAGERVGTAIIQGILGNDVFGYVMPSYDFRFPDEFTQGTQIVAINDLDVIVGDATLVEFDLETFELTGRTVPFKFNHSALGGSNPPTPELIDIPCSQCGFGINLDGTQEEAGRRAVTNINDGGKIVGFHDNNTGAFRGFIGTPLTTPGDFNHDNLVDGDDLSQWKSAFGQTSAADADNDGDSDGADFLTWQQHLGDGVNARIVTNSVPEPATTLLAVLALLARAPFLFALLGAGRSGLP